jgi:uncharacterized membrane protein
MDNQQPDLAEVNRVLHELLRRVSRLEQQLELLPPSGDQAAARAQSVDQQLIAPASRPPAMVPEASAANPGLESHIGSQWLNRVGIVALLVGVSLFLKYAFESEWIGPAGRVSIGLLAGIAVMLWSERFRLYGYRVFSLSLKALGLGMLYLSLWASFQVYNLIPWIVTFLAMTAVTASTIALALWQQAETLALFALLGGFATPVLLYTGEDRELQLFAYVTMLNVATLVLAACRPWRRLLLINLLATLTLYFAWYATFYRPGELTLTLAVTTVLFVIFAISPLVERPGSEVSKAYRVVLYVSSLNAAAYCLELYLVLGQINKTAMAWCAIALAAFYLFLSRSFRARAEGDAGSATRHLHLALSTVFLTLAIAIRLESPWISMGWFVEASALMTLGFWRRSSFVRWQALALIALLIVKVFVYDIWSLERGHRILSFVVLGMLLLAVSFVYQRDWLRLSLGRASPNPPPARAKPDHSGEDRPVSV